jgi:hypothetical protein
MVTSPFPLCLYLLVHPNSSLRALAMNTWTCNRHAHLPSSPDAGRWDDLVDYAKGGSAVTYPGFYPANADAMRLNCISTPSS